MSATIYSLSCHEGAVLSTICSAKQKSLQMCAELRHCQRWVTDRERQWVPQWRTRDGKTSLSVSHRSWPRYRQIAACCRSEMTLASGGRNWVAHHCKVDWCLLVKTLENQQTDLVLQALLNGQQVQSISDVTGDVVDWSYFRLCSISRAAPFSTFCSGLDRNDRFETGL